MVSPFMEFQRSVITCVKLHLFSDYYNLVATKRKNAASLGHAEQKHHGSVSAVSTGCA